MTARWRRVLKRAAAAFGPPVLLAAAAFSRPGTALSGKDLFERRCSGCHALDRDKEGPRLGGVYGRQSGTIESFPYSDALKNARVTWSEDSLSRWLADPQKLVPGSEMEFHVESAGERTAIIEFLKAAR